MIISQHFRRISLNPKVTNLILIRTNSDVVLDDERIKRLYPSAKQQFTDEGFPVLKLMPSKRRVFDKIVKTARRRRDQSVYKNREESFKDNIDWPSHWPTPKTFVPSAIPLPIRQSFEVKNVPTGKYRNFELLKIANFLHLTPPAVERHCNALKSFCTRWPENLDTEEQIREHFPVTIVTTSYLHTGSTIRDPRSRVVRLIVKLGDLKLNPVDRDKLIRLARSRYNKKTDTLTIKADACPSRIQNEDYANYLMTALYFESINHDEWEADKPECDWEEFFWNKSSAKRKAKQCLKISDTEIDESEIEKGEGPVKDYKEALEKLFHDESYENLETYRKGVEKMLGV